MIKSNQFNDNAKRFVGISRQIIGLVAANDNDPTAPAGGAVGCAA